MYGGESKEEVVRSQGAERGNRGRIPRIKRQLVDYLWSEATQSSGIGAGAVDWGVMDEMGDGRSCGAEGLEHGTYEVTRVCEGGTE